MPVLFSFSSSSLVKFKLLILFINLPLIVGDIQPLGGLPIYNDNLGDSQDMEFRIAVEPGREECFYQDVKLNHNIEVNYQVIELTSRFNYLTRGSGDLTINFVLRDPRGQELIRDYGKSDSNHVHQAREQGVYTLCFDNTESTFSTKLVNVEIYVYSNDDEDDRWASMDSNGFTFPPEIQYQESIETIKASINKVRDTMIRVSHEQEQRRAIETRDRNIAEQNYDYVNRFSMVSIAVMITVGLVQIYLIRSLFETKSYLKKIFKGY